MNNMDFAKCVEKQLVRCENLLLTKGQEYAGNDVDRLRHFKKAASFTDNNAKQALFGMMLKHIVSIADMCENSSRDVEKWEEKITDTINYLLLLYALVCEDEGVDLDEV